MKRASREMMLKPVLAAALLVTATGAGAITVETTDFITSPTAQNGFEGITVDVDFDGTAGHTENGITVTYIGFPGSIWTTSQPAPEGIRSWYPNGGSTGYTQLTFGGSVTAVEFRAGSGWFEGSPTLYYDVLLGGTSLASGIAGLVPIYGQGFAFYGFSGGTFDEVRLQVRIDGGNAFNPESFEAGAYDDIQIGPHNGVIPEPGSLAMLIAGFGLVGAATRRRRPATA